MTQFINDPTLPKPDFPGSHMVIDDHYAFISGLTVADLSNGDVARGDVKEETRLVMRELERMLVQEGGSLADVVRVDVHLADLKQISALDSVYADFFEPGRYPARTCTESPHICGGSQVEITLMAKRARKASPEK
ncbi:RidA family protein [Halomonas sp. 141]|uniref:RidA family protein n=1 Tax=unclassified Halomonas TaxID=2609666 RepID=UPI0009BE6DE8|nr:MULTISPECIES: RidA family protein [unclassified Halomonas]PJX14318.1 RidA family protein [Halomonas sp. 141]